MVILTKLNKVDFENILQNYNIGKYISSKHIPFALGNTNYVLNTSEGKFLLKVFENDDIHGTNFQINIQRCLLKQKVKIPEIILNSKRLEITKYKGKRLMITKFLAGREPTRFTKPIVIELANNIADLDLALQKLRLKGNADYGMADDFWGYLKLCKDPFVKSVIPTLKKDIEALNKNNMRKSIIHGDLNQVNILMKKNKFVAFIDWDDTHKDYLVNDASVFLAHSILTPKSIRPRLMSTFLKIYNKKLGLTLDEKKALYHFIKIRLLGSSTWCYLQGKRHPDRRKETLRDMKDNMERYKTLSKVPVEDFLKLF